MRIMLWNPRNSFIGINNAARMNSVMCRISYNESVFVVCKRDMPECLLVYEEDMSPEILAATEKFRVLLCIVSDRKFEPPNKNTVIIPKYDMEANFDSVRFKRRESKEKYKADLTIFGPNNLGIQNLIEKQFGNTSIIRWFNNKPFNSEIYAGGYNDEIFTEVCSSSNTVLLNLDREEQVYWSYQAAGIGTILCGIQENRIVPVLSNQNVHSYYQLLTKLLGHLTHRKIHE